MHSRIVFLSQGKPLSETNQTKEKQMKTINITNLEQRVLDSIATGYEWYGIPHLTTSEISDQSDIPMKELRGVISSLYKKDIIQESELPTCEAWMVCL